MNIFFLHYNPKKCAKYHCNSHVVKMILETCQLLCSAIWLSGGKGFFKLTHPNHPSAIWTRANKSNWIWLKNLGIALCEEYTFRYYKKHSSEDNLRKMECPSLPEGDFFPPTPAMPDEYKVKNNSLQSYRNYYILGKAHLHFSKTRHNWTNRKIPSFIQTVCKYTKFAN